MKPLIEICDLPDTEFKISVLWKFSELQENTKEKFNEMRETMDKQSEKFKRKKS